VYDFTTLSPQDFEHFVRDLLEAEHGWRLKAFASGPDGGVDLRSGSGKDKIIVQCKHYTRSTPAQLKKSLVAEKPKMAKEKPARYLVATSRELSKTQHDTIAAAVSPPLKASDDLLHQSDLNAILGRRPEVERKHFKLWLASSEVLAEIVHSGIWARSEALLEDIQSRVQLYVPHDGYRRARDILDKQRIVVIAGSPGVGKSMLAEMLLLTHWKEHWQVVQVGADIEDAWKAWTPKGRQIFLYDDFLGQTSAGERLAKNEDASIAKFAHLVATRTDKRFVLTTRTQVLRQAQDTREPLRRASFDLRTCVVRLADYDRLSRARIVYNHLYFSDLPRAVVRDYASGEAFWTALDHSNFSPRIVEQILRRPHATASGLVAELRQALDRPVELWGPSFEHGLSDLARELLLTLVTFPPDGVARTALLASSALQAPSLPISQAFRALEGTWVRLSGSGSKMRVAFADPSCRDYVLAYLDAYPDEAGRLLLHTRTADQAVLLLRYASSTVLRGRRTLPAHPGFKAAASGAAKAVLQHLDGLYAQAVASAEDYRPLERLLTAALAATQLLGAAGSAWLDGRIDDLSDLSLPSDDRDTDALAELIFYVARRWAACPARNAARRHRMEEVVANLGLALAEEATVESEFNTYKRLEDDADVRPLLDPSSGTVIREHVAEFVRQELSNLTDDYEDPHDMRERLSEARQLGREYGASIELKGDFEDAVERIDQLERYEPEGDISPTDAGRAFATPSTGRSYRTSEDIRRRQDDKIRQLFRNLS